MTKVYACLIGNWVCLNDDPDCLMGTNQLPPDQWYNDEPKLWAPFQRKSEHTFHQLDFVWIYYKGKEYKINPIFIQIVLQ